VTGPKWIIRQQVEFIHEAVIEMGSGSHGLRDSALLESALARPQKTMPGVGSLMAVAVEAFGPDMAQFCARMVFRKDPGVFSIPPSRSRRPAISQG
jgi:hypothetical protein